uniref:RNA-directed DNA polymerase, eukaryota, reverse transcriptase zinc-binding domain protein n=1 Tax=Tanacetum cinerariifolium TaxID=118510 RepID=A0A6L2L8W3_TANCI|nr:RNA-directed DNA polymerase, eukaryota, reverse transcriptase zinc-binding domain protein [Tanacetum cinerariifolium]
MKYEDIRPLFERIWDQVYTFVPKDSEIEREVMKRDGFDLQQGSSKKQRLDQPTEETEEEAEAQGDSDQEVKELKLYMRIIPEEDIAIEAMPLAIKPLVIIDYKIVKEGKISTYHITRADGSTRRYISMINLHENIDKEDLETLWKLVKEKYGNTRPEEGYEIVLWGDLKVMFEPDIKTEVDLRKFSDIGAWEVPSFDKLEPQPQPLPNCPPLDTSLGTERGLKPPIKPQSPDSFRMKVLDNLTIHTPPSSLVASFHFRHLYCYYCPCIDDPKKHYGFKPGLLGHSGSLGVDFFKIGDDRYLIVPFPVFSIWKAFEGYTRDLGSFGEEIDETTDLHQHLSRLCSHRLETASQDTRDAVTIHPTTRWRIQSFPNALWVKVIKVLHGNEGGLDYQGCRFNGVWARIIGTSNYLPSKGIISLNSLHFCVGCGTCIRFWKDIWIGDSPLQIKYYKLYCLEQDKDCLIIDHVDNGQWKCNWYKADIGFRNMAYLRDLLTGISHIDINVDEDSCVWSMANDGVFTVRESRPIIESMLFSSLVPPTSLG